MYVTVWTPIGRPLALIGLGDSEILTESVASDAILRSTVCAEAMQSACMPELQTFDQIFDLICEGSQAQRLISLP